MHIQKSYICSNKLDVQESNCCFSQFNRIRNHLFGRWIENGRGLFLSLETQFRLLIDRGNPLSMVIMITDQTHDLKK